MDDETQNWREQAQHWHDEATRLRKELEAKQQVSVAPTSLIDNHELIEDLARYAEGLYTREQVKRKWREVIDEKIWKNLGSDDVFCDTIEAAKVRRIRNGQAKREKAQSLVTAAPDVLSGILLDKKASPKHRIDSAKVLDGMSDTGPQATPTADRFIIQINLGADRLLIDKSIAPVANDKDVEIINNTPQLTDGNDG